MQTTERKVYVTAESLKEALRLTADIVGDGDLLVSLRLERREDPRRFSIVLIEREESTRREQRRYTLRERWQWELEALDKELKDIEAHRASVSARIFELRELIARTDGE